MICLFKPEFHAFTGDNQDYVAYICLILGSGVEQLAGLVNRIRAGELRTFPQFIAEVDARESALGPSLRSLHGQIYEAVCAGDPTPFKAFRYNEFLATSARMGYLPNSAPLQDFLSHEILLTREVTRPGPGMAGARRIDLRAER